MSNLTKFRALHGLTQTELGKHFGVSRAGMSYIEKAPLSVKNAKKAAEIFGENVFEILGEDVLKIKPTTQEEKDYIINIIKNL